MRKQTKLLLDENNRLEEALQPEARSLLTDVVVYLRGSRVSTWEQEQVRRDVTRMLLDAQARGEDAREVIGPDPRAFCDSVIEALPPMPRAERLLCTLRDGLLAVLILLALWAALGIAEGLLGVGSWPKLTLTVGQCLGGAGIVALSCLVVTQICKTSFDAPKKAPWLLLFAAGFIVFKLVCRLLIWLLDLLDEVPGLHFLNHLGGAVLGALKGGLLIAVVVSILLWCDVLPRSMVDAALLLRWLASLGPVY